MHIPVFGNGDIDSPQKALEYKNKYGVDGIMIGRASIGNPWFFNQIKYYLKTGDEMPLPTLKERVDVVKQHLDFSLRWKGERVGIVEMRRHYGNYFKGIRDFKPVRRKLVTVDDKEELYYVLNGIAKQFELQNI